MNNENTKLIAIDGSPSTASEDLILIRNYDSTEFSNVVHNSSPLNTDDLTEEYVLLASDVMDYIDKDNYLVTTSKSMSPRAKPATEPPVSIATNVPRKDDVGQQFLPTYEDPECTQGSSEMNEIELVLLPSSQEEKLKPEPNFKSLSCGATRLQSTESNVRPVVSNAIPNRVSKTTPPVAVINNVNVNPPAMRTQPVILTTNKKLMSEVTQTTAKVSIGNTTISVPLLKPLNSSQIQTTSLFSEAQKAQQPLTKIQKSPQQKQQLNINKILNVKRSGPKVNQPTIVSLSQLHVKPMSTAKIVQAKVVNKKMQIQLPNTGPVSSPSPTTSASGLVTITTSRPKSNILQNVSFIKSPTKKEMISAVPDEIVGNMNVGNNNIPEQLPNTTDHTQTASSCSSAKLKNVKDSPTEFKTTISSFKRSDAASSSSNTSSLRNLKTTSLNPTCTTTVKKILASASMHNNPPLLMPLCKPAEPHQVQALVNAKRSGISSTVSIIKQVPSSAQLITIAGNSSNVASVSVSSSDLRSQQQQHNSESYEILGSKSQAIIHGANESLNKIPSTSLISMPRNISVLLTKNDSNQHVKTSFSNTNTSSISTLSTHSASQAEQLTKKLNICRTGSLNITAVTLPQTLAGTIKPIVASKTSETITIKSPIVSVAMPVSQSIVHTVESNVNNTSLGSKQIKVPASTAAVSLFGVPSVKRPRMSDAEPNSVDIPQSAPIQVKRPSLDVNNTRACEPISSEKAVESSNRANKESNAASSEKSVEIKPQILSQPPVSIRQEDTHNVLLKQLLQNTSNSTTNAKSPSPPVCNQVLSAMKVINVRAPSLGLVSSLEAQLARPVIPPVPAASSSQIRIDASSSPKNSIPKNVSTETEKPVSNDTKQKAAVQIISKETSFVSSPGVGINKPQVMPNGVPVRSHSSDQSTATQTSATVLKSTAISSGRIAESQTNSNQSVGNKQNDTCGLIFDKKPANAPNEQLDEKPNLSKDVCNENVATKNHNQQALNIASANNFGPGTLSNTHSSNNLFVQQRKILPEAANNETLTEKNCIQRLNSKPSAEFSSSTAEKDFQKNKEKTSIHKIESSELQVNNNSINTISKVQQQISTNVIQTTAPIPMSALAPNSSSEILQKPSTSDNMFPNTTNTKVALTKDNAKDAEMRKKRKRDYQKHRRQLSNSNKETTSNTAAGPSPTITGAPANKKRPRKLLKVEEDYDNFNENLMSHIRQMQPLQVLEPILSRNYSACKMYGKSPTNKETSAFAVNNNDLLGEFGCAKLTQVEGLYEKERLSGVEKEERNKALSIQNDFYDQEFVPIMSGNEQEKMLRFIGTIRDRQFEPIDLICNKNRNNFSSATDSQQISKWNTFACLNYPGLILRHSGSSQCFGRMSPVIPYVEPNVQNSPNLPLRFLTEENTKCAPDVKPAVSILKIKRETSEEITSNQTVLLSLSPTAVSNVIGVLKDLANLLDISTPTNFKIIDSINATTQDNKTPQKLPTVFKKATLMQILNGRTKICAKCGRTIEADGIRCSKKAFENSIVSMLVLPTSECSIYFCSRSCYTNAKNCTESPSPDQHSKAVNIAQVQNRLFPPNKSDTPLHGEKTIKKRRFKYFNSKCFTPAPHIKHPSEKELVDILFKMDITVSANNVIKSLSGTPVIRPIEDVRQCVLCRQQGDGVPDGPSRLLNFDIDKYVHLNCALWSNGVYETISGGLMNLPSAVQVSFNQFCSACQQIGATVKCFKNRCGTVFHLPCALKKGCVFYKNKTVHCQQHVSKTEKENELTSLSVYRRVFIERDENRQVAAVMHHSELSNLLRVGSLTFLNVGQLLPHQLEAFHNNNYIYPIGYKITRFYWSMKRPNKRCRYICSIADVAGKPEFRIQVQEANESDVELQDITPSGVWQKVLESIVALRKKNDLVQLFPRHISGEDLFGLTEPAIVRIIESLPGVESLTDYRFKYGRNPLLELPLAINPSGAARTEPKQRQIMGWRKPHTQRTGTFSNQRVANSVTSVVAGEVTCPYSKQFVHSKSSQYKKMKQEWRNNVYLARSKIQGLGLYAARDMERHTMIIEYIGEVIRTEVSEIREKQYESRNRGIYMFRLDEERVVDATLSGGLARYINHSCNPNCVTEIVEVDRELRIIIFAKRRINRGEELSYDYKFDIEDDANKIQCMCGAPNCRKWMN